LIYVRRDPALIPETILKAAEDAQAALEALAPDERAAFIKKNGKIWRSFKDHLAKMSYGKCWYSESNDPQSFFDVDHFRPKSEAKRDAQLKDDGYPWLAFSWENFRYSAGRSNRLSTDEDLNETVGKGSWFPLNDGSPVANWDDRCVGDELPVLLDPNCLADMRLVKVGSVGKIEPSTVCVGTNVYRVIRSVELYGLDLPRLTEARLRVMRDIQQKFDALMQTVQAANAVPPAANLLPVPEQAAAITEATLPNSPFSLAARSKLIELGGAALIAHPEDYPALAA
jgi:hypothetical protein